MTITLKRTRASISRLVTLCCVVMATVSAPAVPHSLSAQETTANSGRDLTGRWDFRVIVGERTTTGELWLFRRGSTAEYTGTLTPQGTNTLPVRTLTVRGDSVAMTVDTPEGPVTFVGLVDAAVSSFSGIVTYHHGERYPLTATKRAAQSPGGSAQ